MADKSLDKLTELTKENLWYIISQVQTREEAIALSDMFCRPLGVLGAKFKLKTKNDYKKMAGSIESKKT